MNESKKSTAPSMDRILERLSKLRERTESHPEDAEDGVALEAAISMMSALQDEGVNDAENLKDLIFDYGMAVKQNGAYYRKYIAPDRPVRKDGVYHCPDCNHRITPNHSHCHWCGKKIGGW